MPLRPWRPRKLKPDDTYPLWAFTVGWGMESMTRGRTRREAQEMYRMHGLHPKPIDWLPINAPELYQQANHDFDWYTRPTWWLCERLNLDPRDYGHVPPK